LDGKQALLSKHFQASIFQQATGLHVGMLKLRITPALLLMPLQQSRLANHDEHF
jgi:hypothetical protein